MLTEEKLRNLPQPAQTYWRRAQEFIVKNKSEWIEIKPKTPEFDSWRDYFVGFLHFEPFGLRQIRRGFLQAFLVPAQWPEWFDEKYSVEQTKAGAAAR